MSPGQHTAFHNRLDHKLSCVSFLRSFKLASMQVFRNKKVQKPTILAMVVTLTVMLVCGASLHSHTTEHPDVTKASHHATADADGHPHHHTLSVHLSIDQSHAHDDEHALVVHDQHLMFKGSTNPTTHQPPLLLLLFGVVLLVPLGPMGFTRHRFKPKHPTDRYYVRPQLRAPPVETLIA